MASPSHLAHVRRAAALLVVVLGVLYAWEYGRDRGEVVDATIVGERLEGRRIHYAVEAGAHRGEFVVPPIAGLFHGYPVVGEVTEVRLVRDELRWNAWAARYPYTAIVGLLVLSTVGALALQAVKG